MTIFGFALLASVVILATAIIDWRRGVTGMGKFRLTKEGSPDKFWAAIVLYFNMAFFMFWLSGQAPEPEFPATIVIEEAGQ